MYAFLPRTLPETLSALTELALDLRWTWSHALDALWQTIEPELWARSPNPWVILQNISQKRLDELAGDSIFLQDLNRAIENRRCYLSELGWYARRRDSDSPIRVAYFSMEFGLSEALPLYAGGLGVLAGDYLKTASDLDAPVIGIGLLYQEGYFRQIIDANGDQREAYPYNDPTSLPVQPTIGADGAWLKVELRLPGRMLFVRVWQAIIGRTRLYLLDSNDVRNGAADRGITAKLYGGGAEMRLLQEVVLGIGGWAMLEALGIEVEVCHLNEGHAALVVLERARRFMQHTNVSFREAMWATRAGNVFTTHTPVPAGFDAFPPSLVYTYAREYLREFNLSVDDFLALGRLDPTDKDEPFNTAYLALKGCAHVNSVSRLHAEVSRRLFSGFYPRWPLDEVPIRHVTNGVHMPSWDSVWSDHFWTCACGKDRWLGTVEGLAEPMSASVDESLWTLAAKQRHDLVRYARERLAWQLGQRGASPQLVSEAAQVLDPNVLTLGLARRFAEYKRPNLLLKDPARLTRLLTDAQRPLQLIIAGKAHPEDAQGKALIREWFEFTHRSELRRHVVFLEDYDLALAQHLLQGVDVWINTPRRPREACGTSGMKTLCNGGLNLSTLDGWWAEAYRPEYGWAIGSGGDGSDEADADSLYRLLEEEVVPAFYARDAQGVPRSWVQRMRASTSHLAPRFSTNRMLIEYMERFYRPAARTYRRRCESGARLARALHAWDSALATDWHEVHFGAVESRREADQWHFRLPVYLGEISPDSVKVELYAAADGKLPAESTLMSAEGSIAGAISGYIFSASVPASRPVEHYTARVRAWHEEAFLPAESAWIAWQR
ncbi:alpha-glucan family phosphorylase [Cupriavidus sp. AcVe19-1a]|uniref:alpha-glucan family phosphorylase n=1 Tax=Cupriavidus sp. AcVe19-1a TaxID=2821359 RepID=UPI001AEB0C9B|nr:alpha-glucan family phosphorylase [Cupriavidus sp. AcVe19-1a]